jgi:hypothetical protein
MANYDIPPPTPRQRLENAFRDICGAGLVPLDTISRSLDAIADAVRVHQSDPETLQALAEAISASAAELAAVVTVAPNPEFAKVAKPKAVPAPEA